MRWFSLDRAGRAEKSTFEEALFESKSAEQIVVTVPRRYAAQGATRRALRAHTHTPIPLLKRSSSNPPHTHIFTLKIHHFTSNFPPPITKTTNSLLSPRDADVFFGMGWLGGSLSLGESDAWGSRADINVCQMTERLASCTVHVC